MALLKSISGTRGTIGGAVGENLTAQDLVESTAAYAYWIKQETGKDAPAVVLGRDARVSGELIEQLVSATLRMMGVNVYTLGLSTTPTVEVAVMQEEADGGIILTASHNPKEWNALKFVNHRGEFISARDGSEILRLISSGEVEYAQVDQLGTCRKKVGYIQKHIDLIMQLKLVRSELTKEKKYKVVIDCINSTGAISMVPLLEQLGCEVIAINDEVTGRFAHNPEPLPENLSALSAEVLKQKADLGIAVDPDVDRLALICEDGEPFGEEYTLVAVADYILGQEGGGNTVSNLSSTQALAELTKKHGGKYTASAVGEVNVVQMMKEVEAIIGGEGNGGIIYPALHYGRDAMVGIALFLSFLASTDKRASVLRSDYPNYVIIKDKIQLTPQIDIDQLLAALEKKYVNYPKNTIDGLKIFIDENWIHLRKSNTEPIIRIYTESASSVTAQNLANKIKSDVREIIMA
ncbi:phosphoglucosamine mutase [Saprospira grandis]|uniref:phosphoglucosamine mutase n=1 Tax=Saprospira grandis TaxID=1008 RepID=UPI0022DE2F89|nr:phosphoglucosamine mutase [Saprospira grandis]WBM73872.1 phosphoglucosamine mutase [Saprospira grandis]